MRFLNINVSEELTGKKVGRTKVPIFIISLFGKHTPDFVYGYILKRMAKPDIDETEEMKQFFKELVQILMKVLQDSVHDEQLKMYNGVIAEFVGEGERIEVSIS